MAGPDLLRFGNFIVDVETAPGSDEFRAPCGFLERSLKHSSRLAERPLPSGWTARDVVGLSASVSGAGLLAMEDLGFWRAIWLARRAVRIRVRFLDQQGGHWAGLAVLAEWENLGRHGNRAAQSVQLLSHKAWAWVPQPPGGDDDPNAQLALNSAAKTFFPFFMGFY